MTRSCFGEVVPRGHSERPSIMDLVSAPTQWWQAGWWQSRSHEQRVALVWAAVLGSLLGIGPVTGGIADHALGFLLNFSTMLIVGAVVYRAVRGVYWLRRR